MDQKLSEHYSVTYAHINRVRQLLWQMIAELDERAQKHDATKLQSPEQEILAEHNPKLASLPYNSDEYKKSLELIAPALEHHYARNRHHPQHWENGVDDMDLVDVLEMLCDWAASSERNRGGNLQKIVTANIGRYNISPQLASILINTVDRHIEQ